MKVSELLAITEFKGHITRNVGIRERKITKLGEVANKVRKLSMQRYTSEVERHHTIRTLVASDTHPCAKIGVARIVPAR